VTQYKQARIERKPTTAAFRFQDSSERMKLQANKTSRAPTKSRTIKAVHHKISPANQIKTYYGRVLKAALFPNFFGMDAQRLIGVSGHDAACSRQFNFQGWKISFRIQFLRVGAVIKSCDRRE